MKVISFADGQSSPDWLNWRKTGIGASDIGVIMGSNTYKTCLKLWNEKSGFVDGDPVNAAMAHGIKNEPIARKWVNKDQGLNLIPVCLEDMKNSYFKASLDGYDAKKRVLCEIKCPVSIHTLDKALRSGVIPAYWQHQVQWQMMICNPVRAFVAVWDHRTESCTYVECFAEPVLQEKMRKKADDFWRSVQIGIVPKASSRDYITLKNDKLESLLIQYKLLVESADKSYLLKKELRSEIESYSDGGNFKCAGYSLMRYLPSITYDMAAMKRDGINIDKYIKNKDKSNGYYKIFLPKKTDDEGKSIC